MRWPNGVSRWWCGFLMLRLCESLEIAPLTIANSVIKTTGKQVCIPHEFRIAHMRFNYGAIFRKIYNDIALIEAAMGRYGSENEPWLFLLKRICSTVLKVSGVCPIATVTKITGNKAIARHQLLGQLRSLDAAVGILLSTWTLLPTKFSLQLQHFTNINPELLPEWPSKTLDSQANIKELATLQQIQNTVFPKFSSEVVRTFDIFQGITLDADGKLPPFDDTADNFANRIAQLQGNALLTTSALTLLSKARSDLERGFFPEDLFPYTTWLPKVFGDEITDTTPLQTEQMRKMGQIISSHALTVVKRADKCGPYTRVATIETDCYIDI
ncbi:MAG: hypothetical protein ACRCZQ_02965, partial [Bacteroidales bacterium]